MNRQQRGILDLYTKDDVRRFYEHLHNNNPTYRYVFGFQRNGNPIYKNADRFKRLPAKDSIDWTIRTIEGIEEPDRRHTYVPLPNNPAGKSRWGGVDFDAHQSGELTRATELALRLFMEVVNDPSLFVVLETSGVGFKLWLIAQEFRDVSWWAEFLAALCNRLGVTPKPGVLELFPDRDAKNYGLGLRAFGSWNPRNDQCNGILFDDLEPLLSKRRQFR